MIFCVCETFTRGGGGAIATTNDHEPPTPPLIFFFGPPTRPATYNTHATQHATPGARGVKNRGAPDQNHRFATATGLARAHGFLGFCATHDKPEPAREDAPPPTAVQRHTRILRRHGIPVPRCPGPTPSDAASPVCPSRHHKAGYGQLPTGSQRTPLSRLPFKRTATAVSSHHDMYITSPHHCTLHRTHRPTRRA